MDAGKLDRRIVIQRATFTRDSHNAQTASWSELAIVWAAYLPVQDGERFRAGERAAEITARFQIRYSSVVADLSPTDRLIFDGKVHEITHVKELGRREGLELTTTARAES